MSTQAKENHDKENQEKEHQEKENLELGRPRTGDPDRMAEPDAPTSPAEIEGGSEFAESQRPRFTTSMEQREFGSGRPEEAAGMAIKDDAAPTADAQGS